MGFNSAFKGLKIVKNFGNGRLNNLNGPVLNVLRCAQQQAEVAHAIKFFNNEFSHASAHSGWLSGER